MFSVERQQALTLCDFSLCDRHWCFSIVASCHATRNNLVKATRIFCSMLAICPVHVDSVTKW